MTAPLPGDTPAPLTATERLALSRAQLAGWLDHDREVRRGAPSTGWSALAALPWISRWRNHPVGALLLAGAARVLIRPSTGGTVPALQALVLGTAVSVLRRHPKAVLATAVLAAATFLWARSRQRAKPTPSSPSNRS